MRALFALVAVAGALAAADLPITRVVIYKNGVAYFERSSEVKAGDTARLEFKASEMDDVLKSLLIEDRSGAVTRLRYDLSEPVQRRLNDLPVQLQPQQALVLLLDQWRGSGVEVRSGGNTVTGTVVTGRLAPLPNQGQKQELVVLLASGEMQVLDLSMASSVRLSDPRLQTQLIEALGVLAQSRSRDKKAVYVEGAAGQARRITARYLAPAPVWKSSYRMVLPDSGEPSLEGWAIVDNTSGEDWINVDLTVVSGKPVSFVSKLYEPRYVERVTADLPELQAAAPTVHEGAAVDRAEMAKSLPRRMQAGPGIGMGRGGGSGAGLAPAPAAPEPSSEMILSTVGTAAEGREAGELFEYKFPAAVTAKKGESAMIPFLQQKVAARKLLIYSDRSQPNPRSAVEVNNNTGKTLDGGPITVYQSGAYAGEALMETLKSGDKRLISYAVDLGTRVTTNFDTGAQVVREVRANRGTLTTRTAVEATTTYSLTNVDPREKTVIVEHPVRAEFKLLKPAAGETTAKHYRFNVRVPAQGSAKLTVTEEQVLEESEAISSITTDHLFAYVRSKSLGAAARKQLEDVIEKKRAIAESDQVIAQATAEINETSRDQERIRQNINSLNRVSGQQEQVQRYANELAKQDASLAVLRDRIAAERKKKTALESELSSLIEKLQF
ncbi:MAG: hypothetical protein IT161_02090 [Bryobacterales bacterium]|nr:hypothetical protein [Bryobacterales bacterium]